jgi:RHS repeat-associated protein
MRVTIYSQEAIRMLKPKSPQTSFCKVGSVPTDKLFTGQRLDSTGLYYYGARYYDAGMGRFISPDTIIPNPANPQSFNRYSYCLNNPLKYMDPTGNWVEINGYDVGSIYSSWYYLGMPGSEGVIDVIVSPEFQAYDQLHNSYPIYSQYLETTDELNIITTNNNPSEAEFNHTENGATLLRIEATSTSTTVYRYTPNGFWNSLTGGWVYQPKRPPIDMGEVGQKITDVDRVKLTPEKRTCFSLQHLF